MRAQITKVAGGLAIIGLLVVGGITQSAQAATYPSWGDVVKARKNAAAKEAAVKQITELIASLEKDLQVATQIAQEKGNAYNEAQEQYLQADQRSKDLLAQADEAQKKADDAKTLAGRLGAQLYRSGGSDLALNLLIDGGSSGSDELLARLGSMSKLVERSSQIYADALAAENEATALHDQAEIARTERERLKKIAEDAYNEATAAQQSLQEKFDANSEHADELKAQLAALNASTASLVSEYKKGVAIRRAAALERAKRDAEERGVDVSDAGWTRPGNGYVSDNYGPRQPIWTGYGWSNSFHHGTDFAQPCGAPIYAASGGRVVYSGWNGGLGYYIEINHGGGIRSSYSHIKSGGLLARWGDEVAPGEKIALTGTTGTSTGCHLHFMITINGSTTNPRTWLRNHGVNT